MAYKRFEVDSYSHTVSYLPPSEADFEPIKVSYPTIADEDLANAFEADLQKEVHRACGSTACEAKVRLATSEGALDERIRRHLGGDLKWLQGAILQCKADECPLDGPSGSGDRTPQVPTPPPPHLEAEEPTPTLL